MPNPEDVLRGLTKAQRGALRGARLMSPMARAIVADPAAWPMARQALTPLGLELRARLLSSGGGEP